MLKHISRFLKLNEDSFLKLSSRFYHPNYQTKCNLLFQYKSLRFVFESEDMKVNLDKVRIGGEQVDIAIYDSHCFDSTMRYNQTTIPTVLVLPSSLSSINQYDHLIGNLANENYRVIALEFPG